MTPTPSTSGVAATLEQRIARLFGFRRHVDLCNAALWSIEDDKPCPVCGAAPGVDSKCKGGMQ